MDVSGLPCPPLDEAGLMPMAFDLCHFFDGVDDSGNEIKNGKLGRGKQLENLLLHPKTDSSGVSPTSESELKLLRAGIKLREAYEKAENMKKRKAIQVIEFQPLSEPKKGTKKPRHGASSTKLAKRC